MIEFYQLQQLISVAEHDTLAAAAEQLYISHSTLSRSMKKLEDELEVALFETKKKKRTVYLLVIYFLSIFVPLLFPLPKK